MKIINFKDYELSLIMAALNFMQKEAKSSLEGKCSKKKKEDWELMVEKTNDVMTKIKKGDVEFSDVDICMIETSVETVSHISKNKATMEKRKEDPQYWEDFDYRVDSVLGRIKFSNALEKAIEEIKKEHPELEVSFHC